MKDIIKNILDLTIELIKIPSVSSDIEKLHEIINFVEKYFDDIPNVNIKKFVFNNKPSIIISNFEGKYADIVLNGHLDVVPPSEEKQFEPYIKEGKLYGRGAGDMKSGDAIMMLLMKNLLKDGFKKKKISLILTTDEEVGGFDGVGKLVELGYGGDVVLIPDSGSLKEIVHAEKGTIQFEVKFKGYSVHSSRPWLGENAIDNMLKFYQILRLYIQDDKKLYFIDTHRGSGVNLNFVKGGIATNVLPDEVFGKFDIRFTEEFTKEEILNLIKNLVDRFNGEITEMLVGDILYTDAADEDLKRYYSIVKKIVGDEVCFTREHGSSDGRYFASKGGKVILHRPTCGNIHGKREWVKIEDLGYIYKCFEEFILM